MDGKTIIDHQNHSPALYVSRKRDNYWLIVSLISVKIFSERISPSMLLFSSLQLRIPEGFQSVWSALDMQAQFLFL